MSRSMTDSGLVGLLKSPLRGVGGGGRESGIGGAGIGNRESGERASGIGRDEG